MRKSCQKLLTCKESLTTISNVTFAILAKRYLSAGCPDKQGVARSERHQAEESVRLDNLRGHFGRIPLVGLSIRDCAQYGAANSERPRAADLDLQTLSNLCWFAVAERVLTTNPVLGRARTRKSKEVVHCRSSMPRDGDELHRVARALLSSRQSEATGWQFLFESFTGVRTNECLAMRMDATKRGEPGFVENDWLYVRRSKSGGFPYVRIDSDLRALLSAHHAWHAGRSPWYFPGPSIAFPLDRTTLTRRLAAVCPRLGVSRITSHGLRSFFVTAKRSQGIPDNQIAAMIGNTTVALIQSTYGDLPLSWSGGDPLLFMPKNGLPAWASESDAVTVDFKAEAA